MLVVVSAFITGLLKLAQLPAALLLGPMIAAILVALGGAQLRISRHPFSFAQALIGVMIARIISLDLLVGFLHRWPLFLSMVVSVIAGGCVAGYVLSRMRILPGTTALWGLLPGAASTMLVMAGAFGADSRLVAFMQYLRVVMVVATVSIITRFWGHPSVGTVAAPDWFDSVHWLAFGETILLVLAGIVLGKLSRLPAGVLFISIALGTALNVSDLVHLELPPWFLAAGYLIIGWSIGLRFTVEIIRHALRTLPQTFLGIALLMLFCAGLGTLLSHFTGIDLLSAYLATSPGGADSMAIIAASTKVDVAFVMALQISRSLLVIVIGPPASRWLARRLDDPGVLPLA